MVLYRYAGYCPQLKYHVGQTYGQLTAKLLSSPEVSHSQRLVLHTGRFPSTEKDSRPHDEIWRSRHGGRRNLEKMIPGYTGNSFWVCNTWCLVCKAGNMHYISLLCSKVLFHCVKTTSAKHMQKPVEMHYQSSASNKKRDCMQLLLTCLLLSMTCYTQTSK